MPPSVAAGIPDTVPLTPIVGGNLNLTQMGMPDGIILSGGQNQGGASFTLPSDQVVTHAQLMLEVKVSPEMAARNATLQLMLNGQPLGTLPLGADGEEISHYQLDIPAALMVSSNNLSFKINDGDAMQCRLDIHDTSRVTILPASHFSWESQQLNISNDLSHFPRPFFDSMQMTPADIPGDRVGGLTLPQTDKPLLRIVENPGNPAYKLLLIVGQNDAALRMAAWRLTRGDFALQTASMEVDPQAIPVGKPYDAPRWIATDRPVKISELIRQDQSMTVSGVWHEPLRGQVAAERDAQQHLPQQPADEQTGAAGEALASPGRRCASGAFYDPAGAVSDLRR